MISSKGGSLAQIKIFHYQDLKSKKQRKTRKELIRQFNHLYVCKMEKITVEEDKLKKIAELREILEERVRSLEAELDGLRVLLEFVNSILLEQSFKRVETVKPVPSPPPIPVHAEATPLKTPNGEVLASLYIGDDAIRVVPSEDKRFSVDTPPFRSFLHDRVLLKMHERDREAAEEGRIPNDKIFKFEVKQDGDVIREIDIQNVAPERKREVIGAIQWTLEKMYDKKRK